MLVFGFSHGWCYCMLWLGHPTHFILILMSVFQHFVLQLSMSPRTRTRTRRIIQHHPHTHSSRSTPYIYKVFQHLLQWLVVIRMQLHQISSLCQTPNLAKRQGFCDDNDSGVRTHSYDCSPQIKYVKHIIYVWSGYGSMSLKWMRGPYHNSMIHVKNLHTHLQKGHSHTTAHHI